MVVNEMHVRNVIIKTIDGDVIRGRVNIDGFDRLSDYVNSSDFDFIIVFDGTSELDNSHTTVFLLNKHHIIKISPGNPECVCLN